MTTTIEALLAAMEPEAAISSVDTLLLRGVSELATVSMAISLKRIADSLEMTNESGLMTIPQLLLGIMMNGRQA